MTFARAALLVMLAASSSVLGIWVADRNPATDTRSAIADPPQVRAGESLHIAYDFRRYRLCRREIERTVFDGTGVRFDLGKQNRAFSGPVGVDSYIQPVLVPAGAAPGPARYRVTILDICNPVHQLWPLRKVIEIDFEIVPGMPPPQ